MSSSSIDKKSSESPMPKPALSGLNLMASSPNLDRISTNVLQKVPDFTLPLGIIVTGPIQARRTDSVEPKSSLLTLSRSPKINSKLAHVGGTPPANTTLMKKGTPNAVLKSAAGKDRSLLKKNDSIGHTESEDSEVDSMEGDHHANKIPPLDLKTSNVPAPVRLPVVGDEWEILEGLRNGQLCNDAPSKFSGYMMKSRKWPMKGWHKRYFLLETGILTYAKSSADDRADGVMETRLYMGKVTLHSFRRYTVVAENAVAISTFDVDLLQADSPSSTARISPVVRAHQMASSSLTNRKYPKHAIAAASSATASAVGSSSHAHRASHHSHQLIAVVISLSLSSLSTGCRSRLFQSRSITNLKLFGAANS